MFEYNGFQYTIDEVRQTANELGMSLEDYLAKNPDIKSIDVEKQTGSTGDPTMSQESMGSQLDDGSSESVSWFDQTWLGRGIAAASTTGEATNLMAQDFSNIDMESIQEFMKAKENEANNVSTQYLEDVFGSDAMSNM